MTPVTMDGHFSQRILVLNRLWQAVNIVGVKRGFALLFQGHARVIHPMPDGHQVFALDEWMAYSQGPSEEGVEPDYVHTVKVRIRVPKVLLLSEFDRLPMKEVKFTRQSLLERDNYTCQYCGRTFAPPELNLDHVIPRDRGGRTTWENIVTSCLRCNSRKANRLPHEAGMHLRRKPERPKWRPFVSVVLGSDLDEAWSDFLHASDS